MGERATPSLLVFSDLDDTFLARDKTIPEANLAALDALARAGGAFVPCTGRPAAGVPEALARHRATRYVVAANGSVVQEVGGAVLHQVLMDPVLVTAVYERVRGLDVTFDAFVGGHVFAERARLEALAHFGVDEANLKTIRTFREPHDETIPELITDVPGVEKVTMYWATERDRAAALEALADFREVEVTTSHPKNIELMAREATKGSALSWLAAYLGVPRERCVAFGDADNDASMLRAAGDGVATAGATAGARAAADHVCGPCDEGGVGHYIQMLLAELPARA